MKGSSLSGLGRDQKKRQLEINQRLLHALELHFVEERNAYCRVDELGDIEDVVKIVDIPSDKRLKFIRVVAIKAKDLCEYACLARMGLIFYFDFTRYLSGSFNRWPNPESVRYADTYLYYQGGIQDGSGSFVNGQFIFLPRVTKCDIVRRYKEQRHPKKRRYVKFKVFELKSKQLIEASCDPKKTSNYFQKDSNFAHWNCHLLSSTPSCY